MISESNEAEAVRGGHFVGLKFESQWWFFQALETEQIDLKPWILLNENGNRAEIAAETAGSQDDEIVDTVDREYLEPESSERNLVFQVLFGIAPSRMQVYPIYGRDRSPNLVGTAEPGEPQVPVTGFDSPYNNPSSQGEEFVVNSQSTLSLQAYNPMSEPAEARLSFHVNKIKYATVTDRGMMKAMLQGQQPAKLYPMGRGAQRRDQISAPTWLTSTFGDHLYSTEEILEYEEGDNLPTVQTEQQASNNGGA